jgi:hypothetical protein
MQHSIIYDGSSSATVPSGTLIWSLSSCNKTILSTSGTLSQTGTPSKDSDLVNKSYVDNTVSEYVTETELNNKGYTTETYVTNAIANAQLGGDNTEIDLSGYATKDDLHAHNNKSVLDGISSTNVTNWNNAYTHSTSTHAPSNAQKNSDITKAEIESKLTGTITSHSHNYLSSIPSEYITETELNAKGYLTEHQSLTDYAKKTEIPTKTSQLTNDSGYTTKSYVDNAINSLTTEINNIATLLGGDA